MASLDEDETDEQTAEILLCFYETYEPVFCTDEKVQRIMRSFKKKGDKSGEFWRTIMYAEFQKQKGVHPRTFYERQAAKDGRLPEWMDLEGSEKAEARARNEAAQRDSAHDAEAERQAKLDMQLEIEGRKEFYEAQKRAMSAQRGGPPAMEPIVEPGSRGGSTKRRGSGARLPESQLQQSTERLSQPNPKRKQQPSTPQADASQRRPKTPNRSAMSWSEEQHAKATKKIRDQRADSPDQFHNSLRGGSSMRPLSSPPRSGTWKSTGRKTKLEDSPPQQQRPKTPRRSAADLHKSLTDTSSARGRRQRSGSVGRPGARGPGGGAKENGARVKSKYGAGGYENRVAAQRSRSAPRMRKANLAAAEPKMGPPVPLGISETVSKLVVHTAWWVASHGEKFEALIAQKNQGNANWAFLTQPRGDEAAFYRLRLNFERVLRDENAANLDNSGSRREEHVVKRLREPIQAQKGDSHRGVGSVTGAGFEHGLRGGGSGGMRPRTPSKLSGSRTPRGARSPGPRQRSRTPGSTRSASSGRSTQRYPQSPGREQGSTPGGRRPVEKLALDTGSVRSASSSRSGYTPRGSQSPGRQPPRTRSTGGKRASKSPGRQPGGRDRAASAGRNTRSPGRQRGAPSPYREWRCEWCGEAAPRRYNGPSGPASLCRTCGSAFQASWKKAKDVNQKRAKTPHGDEPAESLADEGTPKQAGAPGSELVKLRQEEPSSLAAHRHVAAVHCSPAAPIVPHPPLTMPDKQAQKALFNRMDVNGNGGLSLAEIDKAVVEGLVGPTLGCPDFNHKPALIRATYVKMMMFPLKTTVLCFKNVDFII